MQNLIISPQKDTPYVSFNVASCVLEIAGESYHEYHEDFYRKIVDWLKRYIADVQNNVVFIFRMDYFNTRTRFAFMEILQLLEQFQSSRGLLKQVYWYYNDDEMKESGEFYQDQFVSLPFKLLRFSGSFFPKGIEIKT